VLTNDSNYCLEHTFTGKKSYLGTLFSLGKTDYRTPGKNIAIYGHHIRSNGQVMFSPLLSYKKQSFYAGHETIYLDSLYHSDAYTIFAVINMRSGDWNPSTPSFASDEDFLAFVHRARSQSLYETGVAVTAQDQILTLITCDRSYISKYGRLVVMAVRQEPSKRQ
jgi:sortase B